MMGEPAARAATSSTSRTGKARVCLQCGYVEMYLDPAKLGENLEGKSKGPRLW